MVKDWIEIGSFYIKTINPESKLSSIWNRFISKKFRMSQQSLGG